MDAYEATKIVFQRIQSLDPQNASKIMGFLLIQDHGEKEMIRLAFGPESLVHSVIIKARKELNLAPSTPSTPQSLSPFSNNSSSRLNLSGINLPSPLSISNPSTCFSDYQTPDSLISPGGGYNAAATSPSTTMSSSAPPFYGGEVDLIDELHLQDQLSFLNDGGSPPKSDFFYQDLASSPNGGGAWGAWGGAAAVPHRRSCSVSDICVGGDDLSGGFGWKPCLFYARGYCKNGTTCRFLHGEGGGAAGDGGGAAVGSPSKFEMMEQCRELLRSKSTTNSQLMGSNGFPYSPVSANKCMNFLQIPSDSPRALMMGDGMHKFGRGRLERGEFGINGVNPGSRQIYLTFPADSTFKEEDVSNYFSNFGPVQDVRIPYQQKRMFGFVTFDYPETVKLILAKGNPHFVCDARVLVKPYKEKGKIPDKHRKQQSQMERGEFAGCGSATGLDSRDPYDVHLGARMFYNTQDMLWRRKLEEQADLQQAIELQNRRFMGLQLLDVKRNNNHHRTLSTGAVVSSPTSFSPTLYNQNVGFSSNRSSPEAREENGSIGVGANPAHAVSLADPENVNVVEKDKDFSPKNERSNGNEIPPKEKDLHDSFEHNLPDSPFASPKPTAFSSDTVEAQKASSVISAPSTNNNLITGPTLFPSASSLDIASPFKSCYFQVPRFASGHETIGM